MGQKVHPKAARIGIVKTWNSKWFSDKKYRNQLEEDIALREYLRRKLQNAFVSKVELERTAESIIFNIHTSRPGVIIGRGGAGIEELEKNLKKKVSGKKQVKVNIIEVPRADADAQLLALSMKEQIEKRIPYRRVLKNALSRSLQAGVKGVKVYVSGRLDGAEIARTEWLAEGSLPLHTFRADVDFGQARAKTTYGVIGIKVWIYKGEVLKEKEKQVNLLRRKR